MSSPESKSRLDENSLGEVVRRAQEIQDQTKLMLEPHPDLQEYVRAAEEAGIDRDATMQALRERLSFAPDLFKEGELIFAKSADGFYYAATLLEIEGRKAKVQFLTGSDHHCDAEDLRLFSLTPGQRVSFHDKNSGMWWEGRLERFNRVSNSLAVNSWGEEQVLPLEKVRLPRDVQVLPMSYKAKLWAYSVASLLGGGVIGAILMKLLAGG